MGRVPEAGFAMQVPSKKLLRLLESDQPQEVRCAAALVLGEVGSRDAELARALTDRLQDESPALRLQVIKAVGKLRIEQALPRLLERIKEGGEESEQAALAAARLGSKGTRALQDLMPKVAPGLRRYIGAALAAGGSGADEAAVTVLLDKDPGVIEAAARSLIGQLPTLGKAPRQALADQLLHVLADKKRPLPAPSEAAVVRLLAALDDPRAEAVLWDRILPPHPPETRAAALQALGKWRASPSKDHLKRLFTCAADPDFRIAAPALMMLRDLPTSERTVPEWLSLLQAPDVGVRRLALEKVGDKDSAEVADALLGQLDHPDRGLREQALAGLARLEQGRKALTKALLAADTPDRAWILARAQAPFVKDYPSAWRQTLFAQAGKHLEASDRRAEALFFLLREADPADLRDRLEERALALRKKKDYAKALLYLRLLGRDPAAGFSVRWELAACGLKASGHDLAAEARAADPSLQQFASLCQNHEEELLQELPRAKWLEPEDLYYLGFHLAEKQGPQKRVAGTTLHLILKRSPRSKVAQAARSKLRSEGLD
jgi:HEAT repeat protein